MTGKEFRKLILTEVGNTPIQASKTSQEVLAFARAFLIETCPHMVPHDDEDAMDNLANWVGDLSSEDNIWTEFAQDDYDNPAGGHRYRLVEAIKQRFGIDIAAEIATLLSEYVEHSH